MLLTNCRSSVWFNIAAIGIIGSAIEKEMSEGEVRSTDRDRQAAIKRDNGSRRMHEDVRDMDETDREEECTHDGQPARGNGHV